MSHASIKDGSIWSSKQGRGLRITHPRYKLQGIDTYGVHFARIPAQTTTCSSLSVAPVSEFHEAAAATAKVTSLVKRSAETFPALAANFDQNWAAWQKTWEDAQHDYVQYSEYFAQGPEWEALVRMSTAILSQVVGKL
jgi:hypothetical protein